MLPATTIVPVSDRVAIDIGSMPAWFIAIAAAFVIYKVWKSEQHIVEIMNDTKAVRYETNSMRSALELASKAEGRLEGRQEMREEIVAAKIVAKETMRTDAIADAHAHAAVRAADPDAPVASPVPVAVLTDTAETPTSNSTVGNGKR